MTGAARLSSARAVKCPVQSVNERNPYPVLYSHRKLPQLMGRKVGTTSNQRGSYAWGDTRATMGSNNGLPSRKAELIPPNLPPVRIEGCNSPP